MSLATRYIASIVSLVLVACVAVSVAVLGGAFVKSVEVLEQDAGLTALLVAEIAEDDPQTALQRAVDSRAGVLAVALYGPDLQVIASNTAHGAAVKLPTTQELTDLINDGETPHTEYFQGSILALSNVDEGVIDYALVILDTNVTGTALGELLGYALLVTLILGAIAGIVAFFISRRLARPLIDLTGATVALGEGKFAAESLAKTGRRKDEVGALARQFTSMAEEVQQRQERMARELRALQVEIDEAERRRSVDTITSTETFAELERKAAELRARRRQQTSSPREES